MYDVRNNGKVYNVPVVLREVKINHVQNLNTVQQVFKKPPFYFPLRTAVQS